jgi:pimeloyl-ACP methyl ester carboxylesterase
MVAGETKVLRKLALTLVGIAAGLAGLLAVYYRIDGVPLPETRDFANQPDFRVEEARDGSLSFLPDAPNGRGLLIMHGAVIKPMSYAKTAAFFARRGYTVYLPFGPGRMSIAAIDSAAAQIPDFALEDWYLIGHSMGGMASLNVARQLPGYFRAGALWATAMPEDFSDLSMPLLYLWGDKDGLLGPERFETARGRLPETTEYVTVNGANHRDFAMYSHQFFDSTGELGWETQIDRANELTAGFFAAR